MRLFEIIHMKIIFEFLSRFFKNSNYFVFLIFQEHSNYLVLFEFMTDTMRLIGLYSNLFLRISAHF